MIETHRRFATRITTCESCSGYIAVGEPYLVHTDGAGPAHVQRAECGFCAVKFGRRRAMFPVPPANPIEGPR